MPQLTAQQMEIKVSKLLISHVIEKINGSENAIANELARDKKFLIRSLIGNIKQTFESKITLIKNTQTIEEADKLKIYKILNGKMNFIATNTGDNKPELIDSYNKIIFDTFGLTKLKSFKGLLEKLNQGNSADIEVSLRSLLKELNDSLTHLNEEIKPGKIETSNIENIRKPQEEARPKSKNIKPLDKELKEAFEPGTQGDESKTQISWDYVKSTGIRLTTIPEENELETKAEDEVKKTTDPSILNIFGNGKSEVSEENKKSDPKKLIIKQDDLPEDNQFTDYEGMPLSSYSSQTVYINKNDILPVVKSKIDDALEKLPNHRADIYNLNKFLTPKALIKTLIGLSKTDNDFLAKINMDPQTAELAKNLLSGNQIDTVLGEIRQEQGANGFQFDKDLINTIISKISSPSADPQKSDSEPPPRLS